jgi:hypothetical protein
MCYQRNILTSDFVCVTRTARTLETHIWIQLCPWMYPRFTVFSYLRCARVRVNFPVSICRFPVSCHGPNTNTHTYCEICCRTFQAYALCLKHFCGHVVIDTDYVTIKNVTVLLSWEAGKQTALLVILLNRQGFSSVHSRCDIHSKKF